MSERYEAVKITCPLGKTETQIYTPNGVVAEGMKGYVPRICVRCSRFKIEAMRQVANGSGGSPDTRATEVVVRQQKTAGGTRYVVGECIKVA